MLGGPLHGHVRDISGWATADPPYPAMCGFLGYGDMLSQPEAFLAFSRAVADGVPAPVQVLRYAHVAECNGVHYYGLV